MPSRKDSERRAEWLIRDGLESLGWDMRAPDKGGQVYTQTELRRDRGLRNALGQEHPENIAVIGENEYWVIEAKPEAGNIEDALREARDYAGKINRGNLSCRIITGVAGNKDTTHYIKTECLVGKTWKPLTINGREATGFISLEQVRGVLRAKNARLDDYDIDEGAFVDRLTEINDILHKGGASQKRQGGRAGLSASGDCAFAGHAVA